MKTAVSFPHACFLTPVTIQYGVPTEDKITAEGLFNLDGGLCTQTSQCVMQCDLL